MPSGKFRSITVSETTYEKLKEVAEERGLSISKAIEQIVLGTKTPTTSVNAIKDIIRETIKEELRDVLNNDLKALIEDIIKDVLSKAIKQSQKRSYIDVIKDAFLGLTKPIKIKGKIEVSKGQIFLMEKVDIDISTYNAKVIEEKDESGNIVGYIIVPNLGFNTASEGIDDTQLEIWFDKYGVDLIKMLTKT